ncbi:MAG: hypothetical protein ACK4TG_09450, partial [Thermaurantiacus sp.]
MGADGAATPRQPRGGIRPQSAAPAAAVPASAPAPVAAAPARPAPQARAPRAEQPAQVRSGPQRDFGSPRSRDGGVTHEP